jgi:hypothetical protein
VTATLVEAPTGHGIQAPAPVDVLDAVHAALAADPRRTRVSVVRETWGMSHGAAVRALRAAFAACPKHPATRAAGLALRTAHVRLGGRPGMTPDPTDPVDPYGRAVDTAVQADYRQRGAR